jgi:hypothetical protein
MSYSGMQYCADWTVCSLLRLPLPAVGAGDANAMTAATKVVVIFVDMVFHPGVEAHRLCGLDRERRRFIPRLASMKVFVSWYDLNHRDIAVGLPSWLHGVVGESDHYEREHQDKKDNAEVGVSHLCAQRSDFQSLVKRARPARVKSVLSDRCGFPVKRKGGPWRSAL